MQISKKRNQLTGKLTWNLKITKLKRKIIFQTSIFGFHVNFPEGIIHGKMSIYHRFPAADRSILGFQPFIFRGVNLNQHLPGNKIEDIHGFQVGKKLSTLPETNSLTLKINGWKMHFLLGPGLFSEANC